MPHPVKYPALPIRYSFYSESGDGRDTFIMSQSRNPMSFVLRAEGAVMAVNLQTGMGSSIPGNLKQPPGEAAAIGVPGYTGHVPGASYATGDTFARSSADAIATFRGNVKNGFPEQAPHFPNVWPRAPPMKTEEYAKSQALQSTRAAQPGFRIPGYSGHSSGHQHVAGKTYGTICSGEAGERSGAVITEGAPGLGRKEVMAVQVNLQPDAVAAFATEQKWQRARAGYTGTVPGRHAGGNFGKPWKVAADELLKTKGLAAMGGVGEPERPHIADVGGERWPSRPASRGARRSSSTTSRATRASGRSTRRSPASTRRTRSRRRAFAPKMLRLTRHVSARERASSSSSGSSWLGKHRQE